MAVACLFDEIMNTAVKIRIIRKERSIDIGESIDRVKSINRGEIIDKEKH